MALGPRAFGDYTSEQLRVVRRTLVQVVATLRDLLSEGKIVVVGGLVPSLLISQNDLPPGVASHPGTMDLDLGLVVGLRREASYENLAARLREAGFGPTRGERGRRSHQTWCFRNQPSVAIDFLMAPEATTSAGGLLRFRTGLHLAFHNRGNPKDAYDLAFVARYYGTVFLEAVASRVRPLLSDPTARRALQLLQAQFSRTTSLGPVRVARFLDRLSDRAFLDALVGDVMRLVQLCKSGV